MADTGASGLNTLTGLAVGDLHVVYDLSATETKTITAAYLRADTETLTNKTIDGDNNTISNLAIGAEVSGASTALSDTADITYNADFTSLANVLAIDQSLVSGATPTFTTTNFTDASNKRFMSDAQETVLDSVETNADVTDTANVTAAGALMDSEVDADIKTLVLPASTTISAFGATLVDDAAASNARTTLGLGSAAILDETTSAEYLANTADKVLSTDQVWTSAAEVTLSDAATITVNMSLFINANVTLAGNRTLGSPTNEKVGQTGFIRVIQDATGSRTLSFGTDYEFAGGTAPTLTTTANAEDLLFYAVLASNRVFISNALDIS